MPRGVMVAARTAMTALDQGFAVYAQAVWIGAPEVGTIAARFFPAAETIMKPLIMAAVLTMAILPPTHGAHAQPAAAKPAEAAKEPYAPGLGEIMTLTQMRHLKLWLAGAAKNWELADYELDELKEGFDDAI